MGGGIDTQVKVKSEFCQQRAHLPKLVPSRSLTSGGLRPLTQSKQAIPRWGGILGVRPCTGLFDRNLRGPGACGLKSTS